MKSIFRAALTAILLLPAINSLAGDGVPWDQLLDRYELVCKKSLELNALRESGQYVPTRQLMDLVDELESLRSQLKSVSDKMPASARRRFEAIRQMYADGVITETRIEPLPMLEACRLRPRPAVPYDLAIPELLFPAASQPPAFHPTWSISASAVVFPELSWGAMLSCTGRRLGGYCAFRSNYSFHQTAYDALSDGSSGDSRIWTSGVSATDKLFITAGPVLNITNWLSLFGGAGYGYRRLCWEDTDGLWMNVADATRYGLCTELGATLRFSRIGVSLSWVALPPSYGAASISLGYRF